MQDRGPTYMQWVDVVETQNDTVRVYANSLLLTRDVTLRMNWTFSPDLSLQCFVQPFYANMKYESYYRLLAPETMDLEDYNYLKDYDNPDFILQNTVGTFVLRWEYRSGSTIFIVYNLMFVPILHFNYSYMSALFLTCFGSQSTQFFRKLDFISN